MTPSLCSGLLFFCKESGEEWSPHSSLPQTFLSPSGLEGLSPILAIEATKSGLDTILLVTLGLMDTCFVAHVPPFLREQDYEHLPARPSAVFLSTSGYGTVRKERW